VFCVTGFVPVFDILDLICKISYNYCCSYLLSKLVASEQRNLFIDYQSSASSCQDWELDDVIMFLSEMSKTLLNRFVQLVQ